MDVSLAVLADYSNVSMEGKLNILGIFNVIYAKTFPAMHSNMRLVMTLEAPRSELGITKEIKVRLMDIDGATLLEVGGTFAVTSDKPREITIESRHILDLNNLVFPKPGDYSFHILIGGEEKKRVTLKLVATE